MRVPKSFPGIVIAVVFLAAVVMVAASYAMPNRADPYDTFKRQSQLLIDQQGNALTVDGAQRAHFNVNKLAKGKVLTEDVDFLQQLTDFSNDVVELSKSARGISAASDRLASYPKVREYFDQALTLERNGQTLSLGKSGIQNPLTMFAIVGNPITEALGMADCGIYWSLKPTVAKNWVTMHVNDSIATLRSWGYHDSHIPYAGWTRPQTWHPWNCGWHTFRDNAVPLDYYTLREQNYSGWSPRGEPNPEVYVSGPWPYSTWPAYVFWWHQTH
jgi:hypothetical protein